MLDLRHRDDYLRRMTPGKSLFDVDEQAWAEAQIAALRDRRFDDLDTDALVAHLYEMTLSNQRELGNRLRVLLMHLLKIALQPERLGRSWINTIEIQKSEIADLLAEAPSLAAKAQGLFEKAYPKAVREAARETQLPETAFPPTCPWTLEEVLAYRPPAVG